MRSAKYSAELLAPIVATSTSYAEVIRRLGLKTTGGNHRHVAASIRRARLDVSHFTYGKSALRRYAVRSRIGPLGTETLAPLVRESKSVAAVAKKLGLPPEGRPHRELTIRLRELGLDTSHFRGSGWARGETKRTHPSVASTSARNSLPNSVVFVENGPSIGGARLTRRLIGLGWEYRCAWCGIVEWRSVHLTLHVDHINGVSNDNRLENLRFLCPNCHSQTDTYCNRAREDGVCYMLSPTRAWRNWLTR